MSRTSNSVTTDYVWDVNRSIPVILQDGTNTYVYGLGLVSTTDGSGNQAYRMTDGLGSTVGLCDGAGNMIATYVYDAFGIIRSQTGSSDNYFLFTGEQRDDESGYDYLRARYYDSEIGRFLGQDAAAPDWSVPAMLNRFSYALNNPMVLVDPTGCTPISSECVQYDAHGNCTLYNIQECTAWDGWGNCTQVTAHLAFSDAVLSGLPDEYSTTASASPEGHTDNTYVPTCRRVCEVVFDQGDYWSCAKWCILSGPVYDECIDGCTQIAFQIRCTDEVRCE